MTTDPATAGRERTNPKEHDTVTAAIPTAQPGNSFTADPWADQPGRTPLDGARDLCADALTYLKEHGDPNAQAIVRDLLAVLIAIGKDEANRPAPECPPEPGYDSTTAMNTPHGYEGWPLDNPAGYADLLDEAAESLHFLFTFLPSYANQRACLANTLSLLTNISTGIRAARSA